MESGKSITVFDFQKIPVSFVSFLPSGKLVIGADSVYLCDPVTGDHVPIPGLTTTTGLAVSADGNQLLAGNRLSNAATLWDLRSGKSISSFEDGPGVVNLVMFAFQGSQIVTGVGNTLKVWARTEDIRPLYSVFNMVKGGWAVVDPDGRFDTSDLDGGAPLYWIVNDEPLRPLPLEIFMRQYYTPRLVPRLLAAHRLVSTGSAKGAQLPKLPSIAALNRVQPEVHIVKVEADLDHRDAMRVVVSVKARTEGGKASGAQDLRLFRDGQLVRFVAGNLEDGEYPFDGIPLAHKGPKQEVVFSAYAFNTNLVKSETAKSEPYQVQPNWPERKGHAFLVEIGVNRTTATGCTLQYAVSDALTMRAALKQRLESAGYKVDSKLLAADIPRADNPDGVSVNGASKEQVQAVLADIARNATPDDVFILSYSGHGYTDATGEFYLLPSDLKGDCDHPDQTLQDSAISSEDLTQWIRPIDAGEMVMILDACYSAASIESNDFKPGPMGSSGLGQLAYDKRIRVLAASQATQPAGEAGDLGMGYLSYVLTKKGLEQNKADWQPQDGSIWLREWLAYGVEEVPKVYGTDTDPKNTEKGVKVNRTGTISLQTPSLFDFRSDQDHGMTLQTTQ
jgi:hypothetical protein